MVVFDASVLVLLLDPEARPPTDPGTGKPVTRCKDRLDNLIAAFDRNRTKVVVPTPVLSEVLVGAGQAGPAFLDALSNSARFRIAPFDTRAAVELAQLTREAVESGDKKVGASAPWAKIKFDRQIVAIARTEGAEAIFSDDDDIRRFAEPLGIAVIGIAELPLPPEESQENVFDNRPNQGKR